MLLLFSFPLTFTDTRGNLDMKKVGVILAIAFLLSCRFVLAEPWKFGIISDTQWSNDDGANPNSVAVGIINQINRAFIEHQVKLVVAVGDVTDNGSVDALDTRAVYAQTLYNNGIGFYPLRGNHESSAAAAAEFARVFPQTRNGINNTTPADVFSNPVVWADSAATHPALKSGGTFTVGTGFNSPSADLAGLSYSFSYRNATFVLLDQFTPANGASNSIPSQQGWITAALSGRPSETHAFVFSHKGLITENHTDNLFGRDPTADPAGTDAFITSLARNGVRYLFCGHDHMHDRSLVSTMDGTTAHIQQIVTASCSYKFYTPATVPNDLKYFPDRPRQVPLAQDLDKIGYYIVTVDSLSVTVDYYGVPTEGGNLTTTPALAGNWKKLEIFGYSLNGNDFLVPQGESYTAVRDNFMTTGARILSGINTATGIDYGKRPFVQEVNTGWIRADAMRNPLFSSNILRLWGMAPSPGSDTTAVYVLSMSYDTAPKESDLLSGGFGLGSPGSDGVWKNAVDFNTGGTKTFISGPWKETYPLGSYGVDTDSRTAWAVVNHQGDFAAGAWGE